MKLRDIVRKSLPYVLAAGIGLFLVGFRQQEQPTNSYPLFAVTETPSTIQNGDKANWKLTGWAQSYEGTVTINDVTVEEKVIGGWLSAPQYSPNNDFKKDITSRLDTNTLSGKGSITLLDFDFQALDNPPSGTPRKMRDITFQDTVTIKYTLDKTLENGSASETVRYTVTP